MDKPNFLEDFKAALRAGVPLVCVQTPDPASVLRQVKEFTKEKSKRQNAPVVCWDIARGFSGVNETGAAAITNVLKMGTQNKKATDCIDPFASLRLFAIFPEKTMIFMLNAHRLIGTADLNQAMIGQAIWNLRDDFKSDGRMLVITAPAVHLPPELSQDVLILDDSFPDKEELAKIVIELHERAEIKPPTPEVLDKSTECLKGLSSFGAEQATATSFTKEGFSLDRLFHRKRMQVEQTPGLSVYTGMETFADVQGVENIKSYLTALMNGKDPATVIVFMDEIEKMFAGIQGDLSGASQDQHGEFLKWTQDEGILALMEIGHPGCTKSFIAKATAGEFKIPMVSLNISALKGMLQGQTGAQTRAAFKMISAIGRPLIMATSNNMKYLPSEFKRRFKQGTWFFDLPTEVERNAVWDLYIKKHKLKPAQVSMRPDDTNWTPDEIETVCKTAWRFGSDLISASKYIVPVYTADPEKVEELRITATGKYLSASYPGVYKGANIVEKINTRKITPVGEA